jgi:hypothetical protein
MITTTTTKDIVVNGHKIINPTIDTVVRAVRQDLLDRSKLGINKYNNTLDRTDIDLKGWLQHAYEECLDQANYLKRSIIEIEKNERAQDK